MAAVQDGSLEPNLASVVFQGYRLLHNYLELERRIKQTDELEVRLVALEESYEQDDGERRWSR